MIQDRVNRVPPALVGGFHRGHSSEMTEVGSRKDPFIPMDAIAPPRCAPQVVCGWLQGRLSGTPGSRVPQRILRSILPIAGDWNQVWGKVLLFAGFQFDTR